MTEETRLNTALQRRDRLRQGWLDWLRTLEEVIVERDYEEMGYDSFTAYWSAEMYDLPLADRFQVQVAYYMFAEGAEPQDVAQGIDGLGPVRADAIKRQIDNGLPPDQINRNPKPKPKAGDSTVVREHERKLPSDPASVTIYIGPLKRKRYQKRAERLGVTLEDCYRQAGDEFFKKLEGAELDEGAVADGPT